MNKKRIIMFMPVIETGGVEKNFIIISNFLSKKFKNISVITTSISKKNKFSKRIKFISINYFKLKNFSKRIKFLASLIILFFEILKDKNCVVFCFQANIYCAFLCKFFGVKIIVRSNTSPTAWSNNYFKKFLYTLAFKLTDKIVVNSYEFQKLFKKKFNKKPSVIYNPVNNKEIIKLSKKKIKFDFFNSKNTNFINVARLEDQKDHMTLLMAFKKIEKKCKYKLLLIGNGQNLDKIINFINLNKMNNNVKIIKNENNPFPYIKKSNVVILTSIYEGLPNFLLEGITLKKLVISSDCPTGPKEILNNGKSGILFKTQNVEDLSKKILLAIKNKKQLKKKINLATKKSERFNFQKNLHKYFTLVNNFLH